jgi:alpha-1,2-mannosyltransferase
VGVWSDEQVTRSLSLREPGGLFEPHRRHVERTIYSVISFLFPIFVSISFFFLDTDETYGYWEPLHYVTFQVGMQTWEYCSEYAIRSYAFILPFLPVTLLWKSLDLDKPSLFLLLKNIIGLFFAISSRSFLRSIHKIFGSTIEWYTFLFLLASPGIFLSSTAYLPSAICSSLVMLSFAFWMENNFFLSIFFGCVAVLWSGWPFVGLIFLPIGLEMVFVTFVKHVKKPMADRLTRLLSFLLSSIVIVLLTAAGAVMIDSYMYGKL